MLNTISTSLKTLLLITLIVAFVPLTPKLPTANLDDAWALGLNQALAQGLAFGKQIIFTLGPYSAVYTKAYHPATVGLMMGGCLYIALSFWACMLLLSKDAPFWLVAFALVFVGLICSRDSLFYAYDLVAGLTAYTIILHQNFSTKKALLLLLIFAPFGLLILIKGTLLILSLCTLALVSLFFLIDKQFIATLIAVSTVLLSTILFWLFCHQALINLPLYLMNSMTMALAFTQAMSTDLDAIEIGLFTINALLILTYLYAKKDLKHWAMISIFTLFLFISLKAGFTRHYSHVFIAGTSLIIAAFLLPFCYRSKFLIPLIMLTLVNATYIENRNGRASFIGNASITYHSFWHGINSWIRDKNWLKQDYALSMQFLSQQAKFPKIEGPTDIYSYNNTYLIASGNQWSPRPIFQSYSAFNAQLANKNKHYLQSTNAPHAIFFKIQPIDNRLPALEDGASWPILLSQYKLQQDIGGYLLLQRNVGGKSNELKQIMKITAKIGDWISIQEMPEVLFAKLKLKPSYLGKLATLLLAPSNMYITLELKNKTTKTYKLIPNMAQSGFIISPLIESTQDFAELMSRKEVPNKEVTAFRVVAEDPRLWQQAYEVLIKAQTHH